MLSLASLALGATLSVSGPWLVSLSPRDLKLVEEKGQPDKWVGTVTAPEAFNEVVVSYGLKPLKGTGIKVFARPLVEGSKLLQMADYQATGPRTSVKEQKDLFASVDTDTLILAQPAKQIEVVVVPEVAPDGTQPSLKGLHLSLCDTQAAPALDRKANTHAWGRKTLEPPRRAQMSYVGGNVLCSPTSVSMDLSYWSKELNQPELDLDVPLVQQGVYDVDYNGTGNWAFNMAYAAGQPGMRAYVSRFRDVRDLEDWIDHRVPVACSVAYGLLKGKPQRDPDDGHLVLLVGFTKTGDLIFNDPGRNIVRMTYKRADFELAWATSHRTVYLIHPEGWKVPEGNGPCDDSYANMNIRSITIASSLILAFAVVGCNMPKPEDMPGAKKSRDEGTAEKGDLLVEVVDTGNIEAVKMVEVKSRVGGRLAKLLVDEGDVVSAGQLIAVVDPQETQLSVNQQKAQLSGAQAGLQKQAIDTEKRRVAIQNNIARMKSRLVQLDLELKNQPALTQASINSATNAVAAQQRGLDQLIKVTQPNTVIQVQNSLQDAKNNLANSQYEFDRRKGLLEKGYVSEKDVQNSELALQLAQTRLREAQERINRLPDEQRIERERQEKLLAQAKNELDRANANRFQDKSKAEEYRQAKQTLVDAENDLKDLPSLGASQRQQAASVQQLKYLVEDGDRQLGETQIKAPLGGVVAKRYIQQGELVTASGSFNAGTQIIRIDDRSKLLVRLNINEIDVARMQVGQTAAVSVDAVPEVSFTGTVTKIAPAMNAVTGSDAVIKYQVEVTFDKGDERLKSGMSAKCRVKTIDRKNVVKIGINFLGTDDKGHFVMLAPANKKDPKSKPTRVDIVIGAKSGTEVEVVSGLKGGEAIVTPSYKGPKRVGMMGPGGGDDDQ